MFAERQVGSRCINQLDFQGPNLTDVVHAPGQEFGARLFQGPRRIC